MATEIELDLAADRIQAGKDAGDNYTDDLERIRGDLDDETDGTSLGNLVSMQLDMTESETEFTVASSIPNKGAKAVSSGAQEVKRTAS